MSSADLELQVAELRRRHRAVAAYSTTKGHWWPTKAEEWAADMWRYDNSLVATAELLSLPVPPSRHPTPCAGSRLESELNWSVGWGTRGSS